MLVPTFLPAGSALKVFLGKIGTVGMFVIVVLLMCCTTVDGKRLIDFEQGMREGAVNWQVFFIPISLMPVILIRKMLAAVRLRFRFMMSILH